MSCPNWCREPGCSLPYGRHPFGFHIAAAAQPSSLRAREVVRVNGKDQQLAADRDAYKTLRGQHTQPPRIDGCADLARRAESALEIDAGQTLTKREQAITTTLTAA